MDSAHIGARIDYMHLDSNFVKLFFKSFGLPSFESKPDISNIGLYAASSYEELRPIFTFVYSNVHCSIYRELNCKPVHALILKARGNLMA